RILNESGYIVPTQYAIPGLLGRFGIPEQFAIFPIYDAFVDQEIQIDGLAPVALAHQTTGIGLILRVCMSASTSNTLSNVPYPPGKATSALGLSEILCAGPVDHHAVTNL